jgi:chromatin segregation and condensation protein Rec8/ScpA/Scc1 (kleisin family)
VIPVLSGSRNQMTKRTSCDRQPAVSRGRHEKFCTICKHPQYDEIEREFVNWRSPTEIAKKYRLSDRGTVYRHAHAFGLFAKRRRNVRAALEHIIERVTEVEVNAASVVAAVQAYSKINAQGQWVERRETVNLHELFERMSHDELEAYAMDGKLPDWFSESVGATNVDSQESLND